MSARPEPSPATPEGPQREALGRSLAVLLTVVFGAPALLCLSVVTLNYLLVVLAVAGGVALFVGLHWLLWGRFLPPKE
jgi:hypothetical protein